MFNIYPDSEGGLLTIETKENLIGANIRLLDQLGRVVVVDKVSGGRTAVSVGELATGIYYLHIDGFAGLPVELIQNR